MKPTAMISQPMDRLSDEDILAKREKAVKRMEEEGYEVINTYYTTIPKQGENREGKPINLGLWYLGRSLMDMAKVDAVYFCEGWEQNRECKIEYEAALHYGLKIFIEDMPENKTLHSFGETLLLLRSGQRMTRKGWNRKGIFVVYQKGYPQGIACNKQTAEAWGIDEGTLFKCDPYLQISTTDGSHAMWSPSVRDCLAKDWYIVDKRYFSLIEPNE